MSVNTTIQIEAAQDPKIRVAIMGGGMGGLTLSAALHDFDKANKLEVNLYESAHQISEIGAGIGMWPRTWKIMKELGFDDALGHFLPALPNDNENVAWELRKSDQAEGIHIRDIKIKGTALGFHRADVQQTFLKKSDPAHVHVNKRLTSFEDTSEGEVHLNFHDGSTATCDILVGMDGIKSVVRKGLLIKQGLTHSASLDPVWTGTIVYRGLIEQSALEAIYPGHRTITKALMYVGKLKHLIVYPVQHEDGKVIVNVAAFVGNPEKENIPYSEAPASASCSQEELLGAYAGWEPEVQALLQCLTQPRKWPIGDLIALDSYASGRIFVGGDAAHAMPPHQGSGAGQAIEDAYILAKLLTHPKATKALIPKISEVYNSVRQPRGSSVLAASIRTGRLYEFLAPGFEDIQEGANVPFDKLHEIAELVSKELEWTWKESAEADVAKAEGMLTDGL